MSRINVIFIVILSHIFICGLLQGEDGNKTIAILKLHRHQVNKTSKILNLNPKIVESIIFAERKHNYDMDDEIFDLPMSYYGIDRSIGFAQIRINTALWIEEQLHDSQSNYYIGRNYSRLLEKSGSRISIIKKLSNDSISILYSAIFIKMLKVRWQKMNYIFRISNEAGILGTLYSTGPFHSDTGKERLPHSNVQFNKIGTTAQEYFINTQ